MRDEGKIRVLKSAENFADYTAGVLMVLALPSSVIFWIWIGNPIGWQICLTTLVATLVAAFWSTLITHTRKHAERQ